MDTKRSLKNKIICCSIMTLGLFLSVFVRADAATLQISSRTATLSTGDTATVSVLVNSEGVAVNNAEAVINFPTDFFDVVSISKSNSVFSLWVEEPSFSNSAGTVAFNGGVPTPGFNGAQGTVVSFVIRAKKVGQATIGFSSAVVRANDGLGTDVLSSKQGRVLTIVQKEEPKVVAPAPASIAIQISSLTHPNQDQWYKDANPTFKWFIPSGSDAVQTTIDSITTGVPHVTYSPAISEKTVKDLKDGVWYFKVRARKDGVWGPTSTYITRIDTTAPQKKDVAFVYDNDTKTLNISADIQDITSGIDSYKIFINDVLAKTVPAKEFIGGKFNLKTNVAGDNEVKLVAIDRAGNSVESSGTFHVANAPVSEVSPVQPTVSTNEKLFTMGSFTFITVLFVILALIVVLLLMMVMYYLGYHCRRFQHKLKIRSALTKGDSSKMLLLLKKRLESHLEILQQTRHGRTLTKEEREIREAIEGDLDEINQDIEGQKQK